MKTDRRKVCTSMARDVAMIIHELFFSDMQEVKVPCSKFTIYLVKNLYYQCYLSIYLHLSCLVSSDTSIKVAMTDESMPIYIWLFLQKVPVSQYIPTLTLLYLFSHSRYYYTYSSILFYKNIRAVTVTQSFHFSSCNPL